MTDQLDTAKMQGLLPEWNTEETHYHGCEYDHPYCAIQLLCAEVDRLRGEIDNMRSEYAQSHELPYLVDD